MTNQTEAVHAAVLRALDEGGVLNETLRGMCIEVALDAFSAALSSQPPAQSPVALFRYDGPIYVRPCERGIVLTDLNGVDLESAVGEGDYFITVRIYSTRATSDTGSTSQVREQAALEGLSAQIMNIRCQNPPPISLSSGFTAQREAQAYREGHRDARHAAAELVDARVSLTGTVSTGGKE